jgi:hypothetical protein
MAVEKMEREKKELQKDKDELQSTLQVHDFFSFHLQNFHLQNFAAGFFFVSMHVERLALQDYVACRISKELVFMRERPDAFLFPLSVVVRRQILPL